MRQFVCMKKNCVLLLLAFMALLVSSCDYARKVAGRPTSAEIAAKLDSLTVAEALEAARADSVAAVRRHEADSAAAVAYFAESGIRFVDASTLRGLAVKDAAFKYCVVLGGFSLKENADAFAGKLGSAGYAPVTLSYNYGTTIVGACPTDNIIELCACHQKLRTEPFWSADAWVLVNSESK